jgi:hypothetical protein
MLACIYKLEGGGKFYIGSTTLSLNRRLNKHRSQSNEQRCLNRPMSVHFRSLNWEGVEMILIKQVEINDRRHLLQLEKEVILEYISDPNCLNVAKPLITKEEKKIQDADYAKKRRELFKDEERERVKKWRHNNPDKWKLQYQRANSKKKVSSQVI